MAKTNFGKMRGILTNMSLNTELRVRILKSYVWSTLLYGCESWTIKADMRRRLEATEMWFLRRMLRVPWTARRTNEEVLQMAGVSRQLMFTIRKRQLGYLGHVLRGSSLEKDCLLGFIEGTRARGRQRIKYLDIIKMLVGAQSAGEVVRLAEDRRRWRSIVANANPRGTAPR